MTGQGETGTPWPRLRKLAYGVLGWGPRDFAAATIRDLVDGLDGWNETQGGGAQSGSPSEDELADLIKRKGAPKQTLNEG